MSETPALPLSGSQVARLVRAVDGAVRPADGADAAAGGWPRVPEVLLVELVRVLREEDDGDGLGGLPGDDEEAVRAARSRARRVGAVGGMAGMLGAIPAEALHQVEEARLAVALAPDARSAGGVAADLLVLWGLCDALARAEELTAAVDGGAPAHGTLLDDLGRAASDRVRAEVPESWTPWSTLKFLWRMRELREVATTLTGGGLGRSALLRRVPLLGAIPGALSAAKDMKAFERQARAHYAGAPAKRA